MEFLLKTNSKIKSLIDNKAIYYDSGLEAYEHLHLKFAISSIEIEDNILILELSTIVEDNKWQEEYKKQFGEEPSFF